MVWETPRISGLALVTHDTPHLGNYKRQSLTRPRVAQYSQRHHQVQLLRAKLVSSELIGYFFVFHTDVP